MVDGKSNEKNVATKCRVCGADLSSAKDPRGAFCSHRCKMNDLAKWFGENYRIASSHDHAPEVDDEAEE